MASVKGTVLFQMIQKLGLMEYEQIGPKSTELIRLLQLKPINGVSSLGDYAKVVICIDIASGLLGLPFDNDAAFKLSGLKKTQYLNSKRVLEKLLDINKTIGVNEIAIQLGLTQVQKDATELLEKYLEYIGSDMNFTHPQYATMAFFQACKRRKVKPPKTKLISLSHLKPSQWSLLEKSWEKFQATLVQESSCSRDKSTETAKEEGYGEDNAEMLPNGLKRSSPEKIEPYVNWKKRILEKAYRELKYLQKR